MKKRLFFSGLILAALLINQACSQNTGSIHGEGDIVKKEITLEPLTGIDLGISGDVIITQGSPQKITIEGQQNIIDNIKREVRNGTWNIFFVKNVRDAKKVTIHITLPTVNELTVTGSGSIRSTNKFTGLDDLDLTVTGSGEVSLDYDANATELNLSGSGNFDLSGSSDELSVQISGSGDVMASNLKSDKCEVHIAGSGDATVNVTGSLDTRITGSGDVHYSGSANVNSQITGSGSVTKMN